MCLCMCMIMDCVCVCHGCWGQRTTIGVRSLSALFVACVSNLGSQAWRQPYLRVGAIFGCHSRYKEVKGNRGAPCLPLLLVGRCIYSAAAAVTPTVIPCSHPNLAYVASTWTEESTRSKVPDWNSWDFQLRGLSSHQILGLSWVKIVNEGLSR